MNGENRLVSFRFCCLKKNRKNRNEENYSIISIINIVCGYFLRNLLHWNEWMEKIKEFNKDKKLEKIPNEFVVVQKIFFVCIIFIGKQQTKTINCHHYHSFVRFGDHQKKYISKQKKKYISIIWIKKIKNLCNHFFSKQNNNDNFS